MIEVTGLSKRYGTYLAVENVNFSIKKGEVVGFLGPNGAGKSTIMNILTGYLSLIAEYTVVGASHMGYKHGNDGLSRTHFNFPRASPAAACSASFFVLPLPLPTALPFRETVTVNTLQWSGPDSPTRT